MLLLEVTAYYAVTAIFGKKQLLFSGPAPPALIIGDILEASVVVGMSGGFDSPFFAVFLFTMAEIALYLHWKLGATLIVGMNAIQVVATGVQIAALPELFSRSFILSRFSRVLIVGLLFVILAEIMKKEELARD